MSAFEKIRTSIGSRILENKRKKFVRHKSVQNFKTAKSIAIIFDATDAESFRHIKEFKRFLENMKIKTELFGYVKGDEVPDDLLLWDNCQVFSRKDLDWFQKPKAEVATKFLSQNFDILFDLSSFSHFPLEYIAKLSMAKFKAARFTEAGNDYDFMIDTGDNMDIKYLIDQMKIYIAMLNTPKTDVSPTQTPNQTPTKPPSQIPNSNK